ncbi:MAG: protein kinase, partial [Muribaculaceae bacterium]|nr:protein kinase [Muribaculaceae bacterium]
MEETSSVSGYLEDGFEGVSSEFTQLEALQSHGVNRFTRAKRYGRWYLLKSLNNESRNKLIYQEMLRKEFDIMMRLQHPGVVQTIGMETVKTLGQCIVMEWIEGVTLKKWLEGENSRYERLHVAEQLLDTLAHIHSHGIAHRDIKPTNIMVTTNGKNVKIIDF